MDDMKTVDGPLMPCDPIRKKETNKRSKDALHNAHRTLGAHMIEQKHLPMTMERSRFLTRFQQVFDAFELAVVAAKDLDKETPLQRNKANAA